MQFKVSMCPTVTKEFVDKRVTPFKRGQTDVELAKIIDEVAGKIYSLRFSWIGGHTSCKVTRINTIC